MINENVDSHSFISFCTFHFYINNFLMYFHFTLMLFLYSYLHSRTLYLYITYLLLYVDDVFIIYDIINTIENYLCQVKPPTSNNNKN